MSIKQSDKLQSSTKSDNKSLLQNGGGVINDGGQFSCTGCNFEGDVAQQVGPFLTVLLLGTWVIRNMSD